MTKELFFPRDTTMRKGVFTAESFSHPAKLDAQLQVYLVERYTQPGDTILDPMAGSGTVLLACSLGRNVVYVELEQKFVDMAHGNWEKILQRGPQMGFSMGDAQIICGDARQLTSLLKGQVGAIVTSPPHGGNSEPYMSKDLLRIRTELGRDPGKPSAQTEGYGDNPCNLGNLPYGDISAIITSPPYAEGAGHGGQPTQVGIEKRQQGLGQSGHLYGTSPGQIGQLPYKPIDCILTSPPYEQEHQGGPDKHPERLEGSQSGLPSLRYTDVDCVISSPPYEGSNVTGKAGSYNGSHGPHSQVQIPDYRESADNIGNLKADNYLADYWDLLDIIAIIPYNVITEVYNKCCQCRKSNETGITDTTKPSKQKRDSKWQLGESNKNILALIAGSLATLGQSDVESVLTKLESAINSPMNRKPNSAQFSSGNMLQENDKEYTLTEEKHRQKSQGINPLSGKAGILAGEGQVSLLSGQDSLTPMEGNANCAESQMGTTTIRFKYIMSYLSKKVARTQNPNALSSVVSAIVQSKMNSRQEDSQNTNNLEQSAELKEQWIKSCPDQHNNYLAQMFLIYRECWAVLRPGGLMVLVVKSFIREQKIVDLAADTTKLCESCGFTLVETFKRRLPAQSFWRILYARKFPSVAMIEHEDILVFAKHGASVV